MSRALSRALAIGLLVGIVAAPWRVETRQAGAPGVSDAQHAREPWQINRPWLLFGLSAIALQSALIFGLLGERRRRILSEAELARQTTRQALVAEVSSAFANLTEAAVAGQVAATLARAGHALALDACTLWAVDGSDLTALHDWHGVVGGRAAVHVLDTHLVREMGGGLVRADWQTSSHTGLLLPLHVDGGVAGVIGVTHARGRAWSGDIADTLGTVGELIVTALARKRTDASMRQQLEALAHVNRVAGLGQLAAALAHALNQPLAAMLSHAEAAAHLLQAETPSRDDVRAALTDVLADNERATAIIRDVRSLLKKPRVEVTSVDVNSVVTLVTGLAAHDTRLRGSALVVDLAQALPWVTIDVRQIQQVLLNLVVNAADAMGHGARGPVRVATASTDGGVLIEVSDHGAGIDPEVEPRMFEPFVTTRPNGLGIGLTIARSIVEAAGGRIAGHTATEGGAVFRVWLPAADDPTGS